MKTKVRRLQQRITAKQTSDGDGVHMYRIAGRQLNEVLDPFLLLDEFRSDDSADYIGGFPSHPHRGFETVTYMLTGKMRHRDHMGNEGLLSDGDVQWMTAGRGVIHSEMPEQTDGLLHGFQLWLNLPASDKMKPAHYQDYRASDLPVVELVSGGHIKLVAGQINEPETVTGPVKGVVTEPIYVDLYLTANEQWTQAVPEDHTALIYVYQGSTSELSKREMGVYSDGNAVSITAGKDGVKAILLAAKPLHEPVKQYGPFVMNTEEEIKLAIEDYRLGRLTET
ncbi:MAG: pirin family protein [Gammaproteobacteria bacterium]|nr:MAG: pirin family protein [Gammaproteobacteria bacterium]